MSFFSRALPLYIVVSISVFAFGQEEALREGRVDYAIATSTGDWEYTFWFRGEQWRSELRSGGQLYEARIGNRDTGDAFLLNEAGETYRRMGGGMPMGPPPGGGPDGPVKKEKRREDEAVSLEKSLKVTEETQELLGQDAQRYVLTGSGKKVNVWCSEELGTFPSGAMPRFAATEAKDRLFAAFFGESYRFPLLVEVVKGKGKNAFRMEAVAIEAAAVEVDLVSIPEGYKEEGFGGMPPGGGGPGKRGGPPGGGRPPPPR